MLDLDKYIDNRLEIKIFGKKITVKEPTPRMFSELRKIEKDITAENTAEKRVQTAVLFLNNNCEGEQFTEEQINNVPYVAVDLFCKEVVAMREKADEDPNLGSHSQTEK